MSTELDRISDRPRLWTCPICTSRWYMPACPLDGALRPPAHPPPPPEERTKIDSEEIEGRFVSLGSAVVLSNEYGEWTEIVTDRVVEDDGIFLVTSTGRPLFFLPDQPVRVPPDVAAKVRTWREAGWRR
jgi:hypothetical protein